MFKKFYNLLYIKYERLGSCEGFTLVEVLISMFLISLLAIGLIHGTTIAVNTAIRNKDKTKAIAVANEKVEILRAMDYEDIGITEENSAWDLEFPELSEDGYYISYYSSWVDDYEHDNYKDIVIYVYSENVYSSIEVATRIYPALGETPEGEPGYPAPQELTFYDSPYGDREILLNWYYPVTERTITQYNIYREGELIGYSLSGYYIDYPGTEEEYIFYITAIYDDDTESVPSNSVTATREPFYAAPLNLAIDSYAGSGVDREVILSWTTPESPFTLINYRIYRDGIFIVSTENESYQELIGTIDYTYYVTIYYEGENESDPSNSVITE